MKILHTADLHLRETGDERWETLGSLVELGRAEDVDAFIVSGDLFDRGVDAEKLRVPMREVFGDTGFEVFLLPGNHDGKCYAGRYFGRAVHVLETSEPVEAGEAVIAGLPYEPIQGEELVSRLLSLREAFSGDTPSILVYHGELLDAVGFERSPEDFGHEDGGRYMPVRLSYFEALQVDYVLAGHFHTNFDVWHLESGGYFVYPGSPVSVTRRETGRRKVNLFEVGNAPAERFVDSPHFELVELRHDPFSGTDPVEQVGRRLQGVHPRARVMLRVSGYVDCQALGRSEEELARELEQEAAGCVEFHNELRDISDILNSGLFQEFRRRVEESDEIDQNAEAVVQMAIRAMTEVDL